MPASELRAKPLFIWYDYFCCPQSERMRLSGAQLRQNSKLLAHGEQEPCGSKYLKVGPTHIRSAPQSRSRLYTWSPRGRFHSCVLSGLDCSALVLPALLEKKGSILPLTASPRTSPGASFSSLFARSWRAYLLVKCSRVFRGMSAVGAVWRESCESSRWNSPGS